MCAARVDGWIFARGAVLALFWVLALTPAMVQPARADQSFRQWLEALWPEAERLGVERTTFDAAFKGITPDRTLPDLVLPGAPKKEKKKKKGQAEFIKPPKRYLNDRYMAKLAKEGREKARKWAKTLARVERDYGVNRTVLLSIWGRETAFGNYRLKHNAIRAIATQAYLGRRKNYFRAELLKALQILQEGHVSRAAMRSSWAGAMGLTQFMPSNFYDHAVDFDGDGRKNIWTSVPDSLASTAKSLTDKGWERGKTWGYEVRKPTGGFDCTLEGIPKIRTIAQWTRLGFRRTYGRKFRPDRLGERAYLLLPEGSHGPAFLMLKNFRVIKTYNFADLYALFVGHLADRIGGGGQFETPWATSSQLSQAMIAEIQDGLNRLGYKAGKVDGWMGPATRNAIGAFEKAQRLKPKCYPSKKLLKRVRATLRRQAAN